MKRIMGDVWGVRTEDIILACRWSEAFTVWPVEAGPSTGR